MPDKVNSLRLFQGTLPASETTLYTQQSTAEVVITEVVATNNTGTAATFSLSVVPSGGAAGNANRLFDATSVPANGTAIYQFSGEPLNAGDFVSGQQATAGAIDVTINGQPA